MAPVLLSLLLLLGPAVPEETQAGPYSLRFLYTGLSRPSKGFPSFQATAYLNDQPFFHYDSEGRKAEPLGPWSQVEGMEDWEKESELQKAREDIFMVTLKDIMDHYKDGEGLVSEDKNAQEAMWYLKVSPKRQEFCRNEKDVGGWENGLGCVQSKKEYRTDARKDAGRHSNWLE
ncbi:hypothetical protein CB1_000537018 [Camelus ferus]|nr:hypothetical protein CB1_000537018 [Camelus ferus]